MGMLYRGLAFTLGVLAACSFTPAGGAGDDDGAIDAALVDGGGDDDAASAIDAATTDVATAIDAATDAAAAVDAGCTTTCNAGTLVTCSGNTEVLTPCPLGCSTTGTPHCQVMVPSNLSDTSDLNGVTAGLTFAPNEDYYIFTDTGEIIYYVSNVEMTLRAPGASVGGTGFRVVNAGLAVLAVDSFTLPSTSRLVGFGNRALVVLSRGAITVGGEFDFSAGCDLGSGFTRRCGGPGAGDGGSDTSVNGTGCAGGTGGENGGNETGGAGGGFGSIGGNGGGAAGKTTPAATSIASCAGATLEPLAGGSGGGAGAPSGTSYGGGGGGALQLTSLSAITLSSGVTVDDRATFFMAGAGGKGTFTTNRAGGGGGAGGAVLIEAPMVTVTSALFACGGGGGAGGRLTTMTSSTDRDGAWGQRNGTAAPGGLGDSVGGGGGAGATASVAASAGGGQVDGTGGGGGGVGRVRVNNLAGTFTMPGVARVTATYSSGQIKLQ